MAAYTSRVLWERTIGEAFSDGRYGRGHAWSFDGGQQIRASASPLHVARYADPFGVDPEEAFVAALSSCHMLFFLFFAARAGHVVDRYEDIAEGVMSRSPEGRNWISRVTLRPHVVWQEPAPGKAEEDALHHASHDNCYLANSVRTEILCEPVRPGAGSGTVG